MLPKLEKKKFLKFGENVSRQKEIIQCQPNNAKARKKLVKFRNLPEGTKNFQH